MITQNLLSWFLRDLSKLKEEIALYNNENDLWMLNGEIKNSAGTLALHIIGNLKHYIGAQLGNTGYIRNRDNEFADRNVSKEIIQNEIEEVFAIVQEILPTITDKKFNSEYPIEFLKEKRTVGEILFILYGHLNYHLGQINYHRRLLS